MGNVIFFDLRPESLSVCEIDRDKKTIVSTDSFPVPEGEILPPELNRTFDSRECYLGLPMSMLNFRILEMPFSDPKKIRELLPLELDGLIMNGASSVVFDARVIGGQEGGYRIFAAYVVKNTLRKVLDFLRRHGADPKFAFSPGLADLLSRSGEADFAERLLSPPALTDESLLRLALLEIAQPSFNFRRAEFAYTVDDAKQKKTLRTAAVLAGLVALVFLADMAVLAFSLRRDNSALREGLRNTYVRVFPDDRKIADEVYQMKAHLKELKEKETSFIGISPLQVMRNLAQVVKPGTLFTEVTAESSLITLKGECPSLGDAQKVEKDLEEYFTGVNIMDTKPSGQGRTQFTITAQGMK
ncbi:MAG: hypothetical protein M0024_04755 [Nitrospiraceae bacterium]|nr:hypothetical protein [Nitrospiraceae bacterium]